MKLEFKYLHIQPFPYLYDSKTTLIFPLCFA